MKDKIILTDADGVLVDWRSAFGEFMSDRQHPMLPGTDNEYNISKRHGVPNDRAVDYIREFNELPGIAHLSPFADSVQYVTLLADLGFRFVVVSSIGDHPVSKMCRHDNLINLFGDVFDEVHCLALDANKAETLATWRDTGYFWIEDHMGQATAGYEVGLKPILINHPYNDHHNTDLFPKVPLDTPWSNICKLIREDYNI